MNTPKTSDDVMREMNDLAKKLGRYPTKHSWEIEPHPGSILDVPLTPEEEARIRRLDALIARLEQENAAAGRAEQQGVRDQVQEITEPVSTTGTTTEAPLSTTRS